MKKYSILLILSLLVGACGNKDLSQKIDECYYPDSPKQEAPLWVCGAKLDGLAVSAVGSTEKSVAGVNFMKQQATANARANLAQQIKTTIQSNVQNYVSTQGEGQTQQVQSNASVVLNQITNQSLAGTRAYKEATSPNGTLYIIVGFDEKLYDDFIKNVVNKSLVNFSQEQKDAIAQAIR